MTEVPQTSFDYRYHVPGDDTSSYPAAEVQLQGKDGQWRPFILFVDSGAHLTILTTGDALRLGLKLSEGQLINLYGVSGSVRAYVHRIPMRIADKQFIAEAAFSVSDDTPRLLGRSKVFNHFVVTFWESHRKTLFTSEPTREVRLDL